jgi:hypothetical protein
MMPRTDSPHQLFPDLSADDERRGADERTEC